jgi:DNA-binding transcriptional LysR family regulator
MELRHLEVFVAVAEEGGFSRAADRLHVVQSAVSATVRNLERELGVALFRRTSRRVELTEAGVEVLPEARRTLAAAQATRDVVDEVRGGLRGTVRLGIMQVQRGTGFGVGALLAAFGAEHPGVRVLPQQRASGLQAVDVREGRLDLALVALPPTRLAGLRVDALTRESLCLAVPTGHRLSTRPSVTLAELDGERFVDVPPEWGTRIIADAAFAEAGLSRQVEYELNDTGSVVDFVRHGLAIALVPRSYGGFAHPDDGPGVVLVPLGGRAPEFAMSIVAPADRPLSAATRALREAALRLAGLAPAEGSSGRPAAS